MLGDLVQPVPDDKVKSPEDSLQPPRSLRLLAFLYILFGMLGVTDAICRLLLISSIRFEVVIPILLILTGLGLLRWRNGWRLFALFLSWLYFAGSSCLVLVLTLDIVFGDRWNSRFSVGPWTAGAWLGPAYGIGIAAVAFWMTRVLSRPDIVRRFKNRQFRQYYDSTQPSSWNPLRWRFSLGSMFLAMIIASFVLVRMNSADVWHETQHIAQSMSAPIIGKNGMKLNRMVEYGVRTSRFGIGRKELTYAVLASWELSGVRRVQIRSSLSQPTRLRTTEGDPIELPGKHQLYGFVDGQLRTSDKRVTLAELQDFVERGPNDDWTIDALVRHAEEMRENPTNANSQ